MSARYSAATLAALAAWDEAQRKWDKASGCGRIDEACRLEAAAAHEMLRIMLAADRARRESAMRAAEDATLAAETGPQPHRFGGIL